MPRSRFRRRTGISARARNGLQFWGTAKLEFRRLVKTTSFIVITAAALLNCLTALIFNSTEAFGNTLFPVTYQMLDVIAGTLYLFLIAIITYHAGVLVWEERDSNNDEVQDALPKPEWPAFAAKFAALMSSIAIILAVAMVPAMLVQFFPSLPPLPDRPVRREPVWDRLQPVHLSGRSGVFYPCPLAQQVRRLLRLHRLLLIVNLFIWRPLHVATYLVQFGQAPTMVYSDFFGYAPFLRALGVVHAVLGGVLPVAGGGHAAVVAARTRHCVGAAGSGTRACVSTGRCALSPPWGWSHSWPLAFGFSTTPRF